MSTTPYLIRAIYEWCSDQGLTPHILVDTSLEGVVVPRHLVENESIVLNIQASAVRSLEMGNDRVSFNARFSGQAMDVWVPINAVRAIFARENGVGCAFEPSTDESLENVDKAPSGQAEKPQMSAKPGNAIARAKKSGSKVKPEDSKQKATKATKKKSHLKLV
jgi:stringent starvation protein B